MGAKTYQQLAKALEEAKKVSRGGYVQSIDLDRRIRERLVAAGYLTMIIRGWYLLSRPDLADSSTAWYGSFWEFLKQYLTNRFGEHGYCLSPETSIDLYTGDTTIAKQIVISTQTPSNQKIDLLHKTSLFLFHDKNFPEQIEKKDKLNLLPMAEAIARLGVSYFTTKQENVEIALKTVPSNEISRALLQSGSQAVANRIIGALFAIKEDQKATQAKEDLRSSGILVHAQNPFVRTSLLGTSRIISPYAGRIEALWKSLRAQVLDHFPNANGQPASIKIIEKIYSKDAYHSLSIEGFEVTEELIKKIASGNWDPLNNNDDKHQTDALAAKGYFEAFKEVLNSIQHIWKGANPGEVFEDDLQTWYRALFSPSVQSGIIPASSLAGYRNGPVYIKGSRHVPPSKESVPDAITTLFKLIKEEESPSVRAVLGHFIFGYIHPYLDGNGRIARFLMNIMLISGGYNWTVIRVERRSEYMAALENCSSNNDISSFTKLVAEEMEFWKNHPPKE